MEVPTNSTIDVFKRYKLVRNRTESLCDPLKPEDYVVQPVVDVSPPKWHLAHTTWFFETFLLAKVKPGYKLFQPDYDYLFNSYYENVGDRVLRSDRGNLTRPAVEEIYAYRKYIDHEIEQLFNRYFDLDENAVRILEIGLQHEQQHQELLVTDIKYILGHNPVFPPYCQRKSDRAGNGQTVADLLDVRQGIYQIGHHGKEFCFDNELGLHQVYLPDFRIMNRLVTNEEYLEFINAGGYRDFNHWLMEGWEWVKSAKVNTPLYWHYLDGKWFSYTLYGLEPLDLSAPVCHISFYEADAYARWRGMRLPTEYEWEIACKVHQPLIPESVNFQEAGNFEAGSSENDNYQFYGDCWEWTGSSYRPYPYFRNEEGALGEYNGKFMINQMVLRGGSCATPADHIRPTYRNFFHPHLRWQFTGIRLAQYVE